MLEDEPLGLPHHKSGATQGSKSENQSSSNGRSRRRIPTAEELMEKLDALPGLLAMKYITAPQLNAMRGVWQEMLKYHHRSQAAPSSAGAVDGELFARWRTDPELMNFLAPMLSEDQLAALMKGTTDGTGKPEA
jgi:hypothetical protein